MMTMIMSINVRY